jgi:hypothetical protein
MPSADINWWAVVVATAVTMAVGALWYSPVLFGKRWAGLVNRRLKDMQQTAGPGYVVAALGAFLQAVVLAHLVDYALADTAWEGVVVGFWAWAGFVATASAINYVFAGRPRTLWAIDSGYFLVSLLASGAILAAWV